MQKSKKSAWSKNTELERKLQKTADENELLKRQIDKQATVIVEQGALIESAKDTQQRFALTPATHACMHT